MNSIRISKILKEFNIGISTLVEFLKKKGIGAEANPNGKVSEDVYGLIRAEFGKEHDIKEASKKIPVKMGGASVVSVSDKYKDKKDDEPEEAKDLFITINTVELRGPKIVGQLSDDQLSGKTHKSNTQPVVEREIKQPQEVKQPEQPAEKKLEEKIVKSVEKTVEKQPVENKIVKPVETKTEEKIIKPVETKTEEKVVEKTEPTVVAEQPKEKKMEAVIEKQTLAGLKIIDKVDLSSLNKPKKKREKERKKDGQQQKQQGGQQKQQGQQGLPKQSKQQNQPNRQNQQQDKNPVKEQAKLAMRGEVKDTKKKKKEEKLPTVKVEPEFIKTKVEQLSGPNVIGKIDLNQFNRKPSSDNANRDRDSINRKKRQRIKKDGKVNVDEEIKARKERYNKNIVLKPKKDKDSKDSKEKEKRREKFKPILHRKVVDEDAVQRQVKDTLARLTAGKGKTKSSKYRREKRDAVSQKAMEERELQKIASNILKVTEFVTVNELATMMDTPVVKVIGACMNLGLMVSINQRLDAEALVLVAEEFGYLVEFITADLRDSIEAEIDSEEDMLPRPPIITVMGHVDHGKTSLLDNIRKTNVIAGEAGGITQHIGAYSVELDGGQRITFLDTPGHEAFTAMRARGAKITDVAIIIVAADDAVMPQTVEAINHAVAAGVPMIFAINKIDKPGANAEKIREQLANMNYLLEEWGGKYQSQEIAAKQGLNVDKLLEKVLLEAELLELKANPDKKAVGTVIESSLDKGRGYVTTLLVQSGTLKPGDVVLAGTYTGKVKAMFNERGNRLTEAGPSTPVLVLGLNGAPAAGETFNVMNDDKEAREIANKREQLIRIQDIRTKKHITLEEIGRRIAIGSFKELNIIVKADFDGSIEAISDSLIKLSTEEVQVNIIHKAVGAVSESDVLLAAASNAIIVGFQVRPSGGARKLAEKEEIEIRLYSVIYDAINEIKDGIEGMLAPEIREEITSNVEVLEIFKIAKVGTVAGCIVRDGKIARTSKIRIIRDGIVVYTGSLGSLKRFKDDVKEVNAGYDCGLNVENFNDIKIGDIIESYEEVSVKRKLQ
ncbi:MAG: translation initiation factor IF-2 [Prevotellaceae bacterium]|jgi:translation initiation factor IF-2|nr:translation initiation factor IF-2 [Prevotellaceae bacterium]